MREKTLKINDCTVYTEVYGSMADFLHINRDTRHKVVNCEADFFGDGVPEPKFNMFRSREELWKKIETGNHDPEFAKKIKRVQTTVRTKDTMKLKERKRSVCGSTVDIGAYLSGVPECMWTLKKKPVKSKILHVVVDPSVNANASISDFQRIAISVAATIASLEKSGYRVQVDLLIDSCYAQDRCVAMTIPLKKSDGALNIPKLAFMVGDLAFFRGAGFGWLTRNPHAESYDRGLGSELSYFLGEDGFKELLHSFYREDVVCFKMCNLVNDIDKIRSEGRRSNLSGSKLEEYIDSEMESRLTAALVG